MGFQRRARAANKTILIVDDDASIRKSISMHLEDNFYKTLTAENGREGIDIFEQELPDLVLVDLRMPEVDGYEVIKHIHKLSPKVPLIVISGVNSIETAIEAMKIGAWDFLTKPVTDHSVLMHSIERALSHAELLADSIQDLFNCSLHMKDQETCQQYLLFYETSWLLLSSLQCCYRHLCQ